MQLEREDAVASWANLCGPEDPAAAKRTSELSIRAIFGTSLQCNAVHASASLAAARRDGDLLFPGGG
eukprot:CAMPEP_0174927516 /NCGR_PEP_ID=MMETSP1355-20121228/18264_1 /TAXON_ID=464990 /ORGANISM="Hemiselmis tepida, Strain CCMP443" /LENGTH=66 /DNA_ID=CAMNT_0016173621 /DNA_START=33 /DNA_END=229 /DNA_ORIENTATION=-